MVAELIPAAPTCTVRFADGTATVVPDGSLIIPDTQTLYYVGASAPCAVDSFVRLSPRDGLQATVGGGRYKVPAPPGATPAAALVANPATAEAVVTAFTAASGLFAGWFAIRAVQKLKTNNGNVIVVTNDAAGEAPPLLAPPDDPAGFIGDRNTMRPPGNCTPQEHGAMQARVVASCKTEGSRRCNANTPPAQAVLNIKQALQCISARTMINERCYMGGNDGHRDQIDQERKLISNCQPLLAR